ncbi:MAG: hypothetical protein RJB13_1754 [Pseudomonadota bacterium]
MFQIPKSIEEATLFNRYQQLTMPSGALDSLLKPALKIQAQRKSNSTGALSPAILLFAGDHAVARNHRVSAYPTEVTPQMVVNIVRGGAAISCLARNRGAKLSVYDVGVAAGFDELLNSAKGSKVEFFRENLNHKFPGQGFEFGSRDTTVTAALSLEAHEHCFQVGAQAAQRLISETSADFLVLGEMGIGNTTPASAIASVVLGRAPEHCVGPGTGLDESGLSHKQQILKKVVSRANSQLAALSCSELERAHALLQQVGGAELSALAGAAWQAALLGTFVLLDGLIVTSAIAPLALADKAFAAWLMASHQSAEPIHKSLLASLGLVPLLDLNLRLGEGSGAALAAGLLQDADCLLREMATFASAGVSSN